MVYPLHPASVSNALRKFDVAVPFNWTTQQKIDAPSTPAATIDLKDYAEGTEVFKVRIVANGPFANTGPVLIYYEFVRESDNTTVYTHEDIIPAPVTAGYEWWNWYAYDAWIGRAAHEINGPGQYSVHVTLKANDGWEYVNKRTVNVVDTTEEPTTPTKGYLTVQTNPTGATIYWGNLNTGALTNTTVEVEPDRRFVGVRKEGYESMGVYATVAAGMTTFVGTFQLKAMPEPPEPPPPEPPPTDPREEFKTPLNALVTALLGEEPEILRAWDDIMFWLTETFGTEFPDFYRDEITGELIRQPVGKKVIFLVSMPAPTSAATTAIQTSITNATASDILSLGLREPKTLASLVKGLSKEQVSQLFARLIAQPSGRDAIQTIQRVVLDQTANLSLKQALTYAGAAAVGLFGLASTVNFLGFLGEEAIQTQGIGVFEQVANKLWPQAAVSVSDYKDSVDIISASVDGLMSIPVLNIFLQQWWPNTKAAAYQQIADYEVTIAAGLEQEAKDTTITVSTNEDPALASIPTALLTKLTPFTVSILPGTYDLTIEKEGFITRTVRIFPKEHENTPVAIALQPIPPELPSEAGRIEAAAYDHKTSTPILASFYINNRLEKATAHAIVLDVVPGTYEIRIEAAGYNIFSDAVVVSEGITTKVQAMLIKMEPPPYEPPPYEPPPEEPGPTVPEKGRLEVNSNVQAHILIGGQDTGKTTPAAFDLTQGIYSVALEADGFVTRSTTTLVKTGEPTVVFLEMHETDAPPIKLLRARVSIQSEPSSAKIVVNGVWTKQYTPDSVLLEAGDYEISLTKSGYKTWTTPLRLVEES